MNPTPRWTAADMPDQSGRTFVVTGANAGVGLAVTTALAAHGAQVVMACRNREKAEAARATLPADSRERVQIRELDLADLDSVRRFIDATDEKVDVLVNNAGLMNIPHARTVQGHEMQFGVNALGHHALLLGLEPRLTDRVVWLGSLAHLWGRIDIDDLSLERRGYRPITAYGHSKLACIMLAYEWQRRFGRAGDGLRSHAAHPGYTATELMRQSGRPAVDGIMRLGNSLRGVGQTAEMGALPVLYAATAPGLVGGAFVGPRGPLALKGHPKVATSSRRSRDVATAEALWQRLTEMATA